MLKLKICSKLMPINLLKTNTYVVSLNLADNSIGPEGAGYMAEMLKENCYISELVSMKYLLITEFI